MTPRTGWRSLLQVSEHQGLFGHIALELGFLTRDRLLEAGRLQNNPDESRRLGQILLDLGWLTNEQLQQILAEQRERMKATTPAGQASEVAEPPVAAALARVEPVDASRRATFIFTAALRCASASTAGSSR